MEYISESLHTPVTHVSRVLVAGGGVAGIAAALAAARRGADVLLVEREYALGGLATLGLVTYYLPLCDGRGHQVVFGIGEELFRLAVKHGCEGPRPSAWLDSGSEEERVAGRYKAGYNGPLFMLEAEQLLLDAGVRILYGSSVVGARTDSGRITHVIIENKSGRSAIAVSAVIDATGDADVAALAGAECAVFRQGNLLAAWYYYYTKNERKLLMVGAADLPDEDKTPDSDAKAAKKKISDRRFSGLCADEISDMMCLSHAETLRRFETARSTDPDFVTDAIATIPQLRMTRRIVGRNTPDAQGGDRKAFTDSIGTCSHWRHRGPIYELPFGALCSINIKNLLAAGRDISVGDAMWDNTRVIPVCAVTGEAAGCAAALYDDFSAPDAEAVAKIQDSLRSGGVRIHISELGL